MSASNTPLQLKTINDYGAVSTDGSNAPDSLRNDKQNWDDILGANKPQDGATVGALPTEIAALSRGALGTMHSGGYGDVRFLKNKQSGGADNSGEIQVLGTKFYHPDGTTRTVTNDLQIHTDFEANASDDIFYIVWSDTDISTRFPTLNQPGTSEFFAAFYDVITDTWSAIGNSSVVEDFIPDDTDCIVAIGTVKNGVGGISTLSSLLGVNTNMPEDGADITATSDAFTGLESRVDVTESDISIHASQLSFLESKLGNGNIDTDPNHRWGFDTDLEGWTAGGGTLTWATGGFAELNQTTNNAQLHATGLDIDTTKYDKIYLHVTLVSGSISAWEGKVFTLNQVRTLTGEQTAYNSNIANPDFNVGDSKILAFDMTEIDDWVSGGNVTDIRIDLSNDIGAVFRISWIAVAREGFAASAVAVDEMYTDVYDNASGLAALAGKITQLRTDLGNTEGAGDTAGGSVYEQVTSLESNVTDTGNANSHISRIQNMESSLDDGAGNLLAANVLSSVVADVNNGTTGLSATVTRVDNMEAVLKDDQGNLLSAQALHDLTLEVQNGTTGLSATATRVDGLEVEMALNNGNQVNPFMSMGALSPRYCMIDATNVTYGVFENNTEIFINGVSQGTFNAGDIGVLATNANDVIESNKPVSLMYANGAVVPPLCAAGYEFVWSMNRDAPLSAWISSPFADAVVEINETGGTAWSVIDSTVTVNEGTTTYTQVAAATGTIRIRSTAPILIVASSALNTDRELIPPAASEILHGEIRTAFPRFDDRGTNITNAGNGYYYSNDNALFNVNRIADGDGTDMDSGLPPHMCGDNYFVPHMVEDYQITAIEPTIIKVYKSDGTLYATHDFSDASRSNPRQHIEGLTGGPNVGTIDLTSLRFVGTGPFYLRTNDANEKEYAVLGYRSNLRSPVGLSTDTIENQITTKVDAGVLSLTEALVGQAGASVNDVQQLYASYGDVEAFVENKAVASVDESGNAIANTVIRANANGVTTGIGISADGTTGASEVLIQADKFAIVGSSHAGAGNVVDADIPFIHRSTATTASNGEEIPAGTYIKAAYIAYAEVMEMLVGKLKAEHIDSLKLTSGIITADSEFTVGSGNNIVRISGSDATYRLWAGNSTADSAPFAVDKLGGVTASEIRIIGNTGGANIEGATGSFYSTNLYLSSGALSTINRTDYNVSIGAETGSIPFAVTEISSGDTILGVDANGQAEFNGKLSSGVINDLAMFSQDVLDYIAPPVAGTTGGNASLSPLPAGYTDNVYLPILTIPSGNANPVTVSFQFKDSESSQSDTTPTGYSAPVYDVTVQRSINDGTWTTLSGWSGKRYTGTATNWYENEPGAPNFYWGSFSININETITDNSHGAGDNDKLEYRVKFDRISGSTNSGVPVKAWQIAQATAGGGQAGIASALNTPYMALEDSGSYPALLPESLNTASETSWVRTNPTGLIPYANGGNSSSLGTSTWPFKTIYGVTLYEDGTALSAKYVEKANPSFTGVLRVDRIDCSGNQGLWLTAGESDSQVNSGNTGNNEFIYMGAESGLVIYSSPDNWSSAFAGANVATINDASGNSVFPGNITGFSDERLKENIEVIMDAVEKIMQVRGVTFTRNDLADKTKRHAGVIAQEIQKVLPEVIVEKENGILTVNYGALVSLLIEAIKEQQNDIQTMKKDIDSIKKFLNI